MSAERTIASNGYNGRILHVDLHERITKLEPLTVDVAQSFVGGKGLGAYLLYRELVPHLDPLDPGNVCIMAVGPLTGSQMQTSGRWCIVTKSPQTGAYLDSQVGGHFGTALKGAGFDAVVVHGRSDRPVFIVLENQQVSLEDAGDLWGKGIFETTEILSERYPGGHVSAIGPAGEQEVKYACVGVDRYRQAGRGDLGAVWGSKNLKAIVARGSWRENPADVELFRGAVRAMMERIREDKTVRDRRMYGTPMWVDVVNEGGLLPTYNFRLGRFAQVEAISARSMKSKIVVGNSACANCAIACGKRTRVSSGPFQYPELEGPEYETIALMGSNCGIASIEAIGYLNWLCDDLGLDTISTGNVLGFCMEAFQRGIREAPRIRFGDARGASRMVKAIALRKGLGDLLAQGVQSIAKAWGKGTSGWAMHVKGMEIPGYDPRGAFGMALAYATSDRGACHQRAWTVNAELTGELSPPLSFAGRARFVKEKQDLNAIVFSLLRCDFAPCPDSVALDLLNGMTGLSLDRDGYAAVGERIWNQVRLFNVREGFSRKDDVLPARFFDESLNSNDRMRLKRDAFATALSEYYAMRGWDEDGIPQPAVLNRLGLTKNRIRMPRAEERGKY